MLVTAPSVDPNKVRFLAKAAEIDGKRVDEITKDEKVEVSMSSAHVSNTDEIARLVL